jgi:hypothetical protein
MALIFATGIEDTRTIMELAAKGPSLGGLQVIHLDPKTASRQLSQAGASSKNIVATAVLAQKSGEVVSFPYPLSLFSKFRPDLFIILETDDDDTARQKANTHMALSSAPGAVKIIKMDRENIKKAILDIRKALSQVTGT